MKLFTTTLVSGLIALNLSGCFSTKEDFPGTNEAKDSQSTPMEKNEEPETDHSELKIKGKDYFDGRVEPFRHNWYVMQLKAMEEDALMGTEPGDGLKFRFLWLRSFHQPYVVRGYKDKDGKLKLHMKSADGAGGYEPGNKLEDVFVHLTETQSIDFETRLKRLNICEPDVQPNWGTDGAQWIFEIIDDGKYCLVDIWSPDENSLYRQFGLDLLKTSRVKIWEISVY